MRNSGPKASYAYNACRDGLFKDDPSKKFKKGDGLDYFCKLLQASFLDKGMDTICYRKDPIATGSTMIDVLECHPRLNKETMKKQSSWFARHFDSYDKENDASAKMFLLNSLSEELKKPIESKIESTKDDLTFVDVLFVFLENQRPVSADLYTHLECVHLNGGEWWPFCVVANTFIDLHIYQFTV